jgi:hypothetical protein
MPAIPNRYVVEPTLVAWLNREERGALDVRMICLVIMKLRRFGVDAMIHA